MFRERGGDSCYSCGQCVTPLCSNRSRHRYPRFVTPSNCTLFLSTLKLLNLNLGTASFLRFPFSHSLSFFFPLLRSSLPLLRTFASAHSWSPSLSLRQLITETAVQLVLGMQFELSWRSVWRHVVTEWFIQAASVKDSERSIYESGQILLCLVKLFSCLIYYC